MCVEMTSIAGKKREHGCGELVVVERHGSIERRCSPRVTWDHGVGDA